MSLRDKIKYYESNISSDILAQPLLKAANLSEYHKQLTRAIISSLKYTAMKMQPKKIFSNNPGGSSLQNPLLEMKYHIKKFYFQIIADTKPYSKVWIRHIVITKCHLIFHYHNAKETHFNIFAIQNFVQNMKKHIWISFIFLGSCL